MGIPDRRWAVHRVSEMKSGGLWSSFPTSQSRGPPVVALMNDTINGFEDAIAKFRW
jgi:hypothetical protein